MYIYTLVYLIKRGPRYRIQINLYKIYFNTNILDTKPNQIYNKLCALIQTTECLRKILN